MQGVEIGDKHVEVMVRQMLRACVMDPGSTEILPGTLLDIGRLQNVNRSAIMNGEVPATARPVLGITKASLETNSFLCLLHHSKKQSPCLDRCFCPRQERITSL